jgi:ketosteroid isomerase-like protein
VRRIGLGIAGVLTATMLALGFAYTADAAGDAQAEIIEFEHKCIAATNTDQAMTCMDEKKIVLYDFAPPRKYAGAKAVRGDLDNFFNNAKDAKGDFVELEVVTDGKLGVVRSVQHFTWKDKDGKPMEATFRVTDALHKVKGQWKIFHSHVSVPVDPATGKGDMQSKT